jgi:hypothetical protein
MARVIERKDANEVIRAKLKACDAAIGRRNPDGAQLRRIERAHQVQR